MKKENETRSESTAEPKKARRELLSSSGLAAFGAVFGLVAAACSDDDDGPTKNPTPDGGRSDAGATPHLDGSVPSIDSGLHPDSGAIDAGAGTDKDIASLNALLEAEYLAIEAYTKGAAAIGQATSADPLFPLASAITKVAVKIQSQHRVHASALVSAITSLGGTPADQDTTAATLVLDKGLTDNPTIMNVLKFAALKERGAAVAYNKTITGLEAAKYRFLASAIEGDESQHFIVLAALVLGLATPSTTISDNTDKVFPANFVHSFDANDGLDTKVTPYFA